ncbi:MAG TPA: HAD family phosphatase [Nitrospirota bacterium]|jgi:FMN phosphatase YigB (HAD superfamily)
MEISNGKIKAVFFDLGKVILSFSHDDIVGRLLSCADPDSRRPDELHRYLFDMEDGLCNLYDAGLISSEDFYKEIDSRFNTGVDYNGFVPLWNGIFEGIPGVPEIIREVRRKRPVYLLSNINELHWEHIRGRYQVLSELDGLVLSCEVKARKPEPAIYRVAMETAGVGPGESIFVDDLQINIDAARSHGIKGIAFTGLDRLRADLTALGLAG